MEALTRIDSCVVPIPITDCDTDQIVPSRYLSEPRTPKLADRLFASYRSGVAAGGRPAFILDDPRYRHHKILVAGANFGCGSSREHAVWTLYEYGFRVVIAPSFGEIFHDNCLKNGLLPIVLPQRVVDDLLEQAGRGPDCRVVVDIPAQTVSLPGGEVLGFDLNAFAKTCLTQGMDEIAYTLSRQDLIAAYERAYADADV